MLNIEYKKQFIEGYEGLYEIDTNGVVYSSITTAQRRKGALTPDKKNGYLSVNLYKDKTMKHCYVHRLVAQAFIPNPENKKHVNHIDCDKHNNCVSNLEWCSAKENIKHSVMNKRQKHYLTTFVDGVEYDCMRYASESVFGKSWLIRDLRYKYGSEFTYKGKQIKVVMQNV